MVANGPGGSNALSGGDEDGRGAITANPNLIVASRDIAACDSVGLAVLKCYAKKINEQNSTGAKKYVGRSVWADGQIKRIGELGLGINDPTKITLVQKGVDDFAQIRAEWV
jgi:uncharacterized protein (DUF362 family)